MTGIKIVKISYFHQEHEEKKNARKGASLNLEVTVKTKKVKYNSLSQRSKFGTSTFRKKIKKKCTIHPNLSAAATIIYDDLQFLPPFQ